MRLEKRLFIYFVAACFMWWLSLAEIMFLIIGLTICEEAFRVHEKAAKDTATAVSLKAIRDEERYRDEARRRRYSLDGPPKDMPLPDPEAWLEASEAGCDEEAMMRSYWWNWENSPDGGALIT
jgi:hypothetical protein